MAHDISIRFFSTEEEALFQKCLSQIPNAADVIVQPLDRVGYSGARVFVFLPHGKHSHPHVGKIHTKEGITREKTGRGHAYHVFPEALQMGFFAEADGGEDRAILAMPVIVNDENAVIELKDILFSPATSGASNPTGPEYSTDRILGVYRSLYEKNCRKCVEGVSLSQRSLAAEYNWYLRNNKTERLLDMAGQNKK